MHEKFFVLITFSYFRIECTKTHMIVATVAVILIIVLVGTGLGLGLKNSNVDSGANSTWSIDFMGNLSKEDSFRIYRTAPEASETLLGTYDKAAVSLDGKPCAEIAR